MLVIARAPMSGSKKPQTRPSLMFSRAQPSALAAKYPASDASSP